MGGSLAFIRMAGSGAAAGAGIRTKRDAVTQLVSDNRMHAICQVCQQSAEPCTKPFLPGLADRHQQVQGSPSWHLLEASHTRKCDSEKLRGCIDIAHQDDTGHPSPQAFRKIQMK